ncbi:NAD(P)-binding domain-containing protein [Micromonospora sp. 4G55]|nr:NAD(P)-binding domain-containing protein [Micromonospora sp. 4G55]
MATVAVIGLGGMGSRMAGRLLDAGHDLVVWNRTPQRASDLVARGAVAAGSPAEAARRADLVITMLSGPAALQEVVEGPQGVAAGSTASTTLAEMSTVGPPAVRRLAAMLPDGVGLLDAPVLGSVSEAESGSLRIFVGGPEQLAQQWMPLLGALGSPMHVGPLGAGAAAKLVANSTLFGVLAVLGEALALADGLGLRATSRSRSCPRLPSARKRIGGGRRSSRTNSRSGSRCHSPVRTPIWSWRPPSRRVSNCRSPRPLGSGSWQPRKPASATGTTRPYSRTSPTLPEQPEPGRRQAGQVAVELRLHVAVGLAQPLQARHRSTHTRSGNPRPGRSAGQRGGGDEEPKPVSRSGWSGIGGRSCPPWARRLRRRP